MGDTGRGKLVVVGAAGRTGRLIVEYGLANQYDVRAVVRDPSRLQVTHRRLETVTADVLTDGALDGMLEGADAVAVALGTPNRSATTVFSQGIRNILDAAGDSGTRRLLAMSSAGLETGHLPPVQRLVSRFVVERVYREIHLDLSRMEDEIEASGLDWTIVRVPMLKDGPATPNYRAVVGGHLPKAGTATRANVAHWIVDHLHDASTFLQRVEVGDG